MSDSLARWHQQFGDRQPYYPRLARVAGSAAASILLDYLLTQQQSATAPVLDPAAIATATGLNTQELAGARQQLRDRDLLQERLASDDTIVGEINLERLGQRLSAFAQLLEPVPAVVAETSPVTDRFFPVSHQPPEIPVNPHYRFAGPWRSPDELAAFQRALIDYFKYQGARQPDDKAFWTIDGLSKGLVSSYWDEFVAGLPLGSSQRLQRDWELAPGVPYPAFEEDRTQYYCQRGEPIEAAVERARRDLRDPTRGQDLWDGFLRKCDRLADEARKARALGVRTPYLPPAFTERPAPTKQSVMAKLAAASALPAPAKPEPAPLPSTPSHQAAKPPLATLQSLYKSPLGRKIVEQQLADYPEWGYEIAAGEVIDRAPERGKTRPD